MLQGIVALNGKICSGKSEQAQRLVAGGDGLWVRGGFADELKRDAAFMLGIGVEDLKDPAIKEIARPVLQAFGNSMRLLKGENFWCRRLMSSHKVKLYPYLVVDDVRYPNELAYLRHCAWLAGVPFCAVRLYFGDRQATGQSPLQDARYLATYGKPLTWEVRNHISETALDDYCDWDMLLNTQTPAHILSAQLVLSLINRGFETVQSVRGALDAA